MKDNNTINVWTQTWTTCGDAFKAAAVSGNKAAAKTTEAGAKSTELLAHGAFVTADASCVGLDKLRAWFPKDGTEAIDRTSEFVSDFFDDDEDIVADIVDAVSE